MHTNHAIHRQIALAIAISAIAAPAASAGSSPAPSRTAQSHAANASLVVRPNPDQQIGQSGVVVRPNPDQQIGHRGSALGAHNRARAVMNLGTTSPFRTGNNPRGIAIAAHPPKRTVNDRKALAHAFAQTHSSLDHALYRPSGPGAGGSSLLTLKAISNAAAVHPTAVAPPAITPPSEDFDYGAAALGAGITAAIAVLIAGGTLGLRQRTRTRHP